MGQMGHFPATRRPSTQSDWFFGGASDPNDLYFESLFPQAQQCANSSCDDVRLCLSIESNDVSLNSCKPQKNQDACLEWAAQVLK